MNKDDAVGVKNVLGWVVGILGSIVLITALLFYFGWVRLPLENLNRQVTTHTQAYIQTHQTMMLDYYADWQSGDAAHKAAARTKVCAESVLLDRHEWPSQMLTFINTNCQ